MPNDQFFFEDDDIILSFDDDLIEEIIPSVDIKEQRFREDSVVRLNKDQITSEITNLLIDRHRNVNILKSKVKNFNKLFFEYPAATNIKFKQLRPIVYTDKLMYFTNDDEHTQNKEYEYEHFQKSEKLANFINQFHSINRDMSKQSYIQSANKLYALYTPFLNRDDGNAPQTLYSPDESVDAFRHCLLEEYDCSSQTHEIVRLMPKVTNNNISYYEGDQVNILGFLNVANDMDSNLHDVHIFDLQHYLDNVKQLSEKDQVVVVFNEPVFDKDGTNLLKTLKAKVIKVTKDVIELELSAMVHYKSQNVDTIVYHKERPNNGVFVYPVEEYNNKPKKYCFAKHHLSSHDIVFKLPKNNTMSVADLKEFLLPSSIGELIMLYEKHFKYIYNLHDLAIHILLPNNINIDNLEDDVHSLLLYIFQCDKPKMKSFKSVKRNFTYLPYRNTTTLVDFEKHKGEVDFYEHKYPSQDAFIDDALNRYRYLKSQADKGAYFFLHLIKLNIQKKYKRHISKLSKYQKHVNNIDKELDRLNLPSSTQAQNECKHSYAKEYSKLNKLLDDNGKVVYFDKKFDKSEYQIKAEFSGNSAKELRLFVTNELLNKGHYKQMSKTDLEFEVNTIIEGQRKVRVGDICVLHTNSGDVIYTRQQVEGKLMWVKKFRTPFKVCTDNPLINFNDLIKLDTCIKQSFEDVCRTNKHAKVMHKYQLLVSMKTEVSLILSLLNKYDYVIQQIDDDIIGYKHYVDMKRFEKPLQRNFEYEEHKNYDEFAGDEGDVNDVDYMIDFNEKDNFVVSYGGNPSSDEATKLQQVDNYEILNIVLSFTQIPLDGKEMMFILSYINSKYPKQLMFTTLQKYELFLLSQVKPEYKGNEKYMKMYETLVKQKLQKKEEELLKQYYFNVIRTVVALFIIIIFVRYPDYVMKVVLPNCVKLLSYMGYPVHEKDGQKSLVAYFSCLITSISVNDDVRFQLFYEKEQSEIQKVLKESIDEVLKDNYELSKQLEMSKMIMKSVNHAIKVEHENEFGEIEGFKPHYKFGNIDKMSKTYKYVVNYLKTIQDVVSQSKILKQNILNIPNLFNACCVETLTRKTQFFDFFNDSNDFKRVQTYINTHAERHLYVDDNLHPTQRKISFSNLFERLSITHKDAIPVVTPIGDAHDQAQRNEHVQLIKAYLEQNVMFWKEDTMLNDMVTNFNSENWWNDKFYPLLNEEFDGMFSILQKINPNIDKSVIEYIKNNIITIVDVSDVSTLRQALYNFIHTKLRHYLGKIVNKQKFTGDITNDEVRQNPLFIILSSVTNNKNYDVIVKKLKENLNELVPKSKSLYFESNQEDMVIKNVSLLAYILIATLKKLLALSTSSDSLSNVNLFTILTDSSIIKKENMSLTADIIVFLVNKLHEYLKNTVVDNEALKMSVEKLREQRKEEELSKFKLDDEERELQMQLKKMGLKGWADILNGDDMLTEDMSEEQHSIMNPKVVVKDEYEQEKDEIYNYYKGENDDADEVDEDFVSYEAYDYA